jgi:succinylarginine dihydrolase
MKFLHDLGVRQAVLPPHPRPDLAALRRLGFHGGDADVLWRAHREDPRLLAAAYSASAMWAANAATVSPAADTGDGRLHITPANLIAHFHRSLEAPFTAAVLRAIFPEGEHFAHHAPLPAADAFSDEGAANHMRLCAAHEGAGVEVFVFGRRAGISAASRFPARQTFESAAAMVRLHQLHPDRVVFAQQSPAAIDAGVFHNDVIAVANQDVLLCHGGAWVDGQQVVAELRRKFAAACGGELRVFMADPDELTLQDAVETYLFNGQLVTLPDGGMSLIAPTECRDHVRVQQFLARVLDAGGPVHSVHYLNVRQSMRNGGGPACLRLRVVLTESQLAQVRPNVLFDERLYGQLTRWVTQHYRDKLSPDDLADPAFAGECMLATEELSRLLQCGDFDGSGSKAI